MVLTNENLILLGGGGSPLVQPQGGVNTVFLQAFVALPPIILPVYATVTEVGGPTAGVRQVSEPTAELADEPALSVAIYDADS